MASPHHLLNTSWTSHRLSPLHYEIEHEAGSVLETTSLLTNKTALDTYAARLRDHLTNSLAVAGALALQDDLATSLTLGALQSCTWETISSLSFLDVEQEQGGEPVGLLITLTYETATYKAVLLAAPGTGTASTSSNQAQPQQEEQKEQKKRRRGRPSLKSANITNISSSTHLPLLLTRLPKPVRETFLNFLSSNFDTYISALRIPSTALCGVLERYVENLTPVADVDVDVDVEDIIREIHLTLSFAPPIAPELKALNVSIPRDRLGAFMGGSTSSVIGNRGSVLSGLSAYLSKHLAIDLGLPLPAGESAATAAGSSSSLVGGYVRLTRVACAGFVVTAEGRLKVVAKAENGEGDERNRGALRGGEALLRAILERAAMGIGADKEAQE